MIIPFANYNECRTEWLRRLAIQEKQTRMAHQKQIKKQKRKKR